VRKSGPAAGEHARLRPQRRPCVTAGPRCPGLASFDRNRPRGLHALDAAVFTGPGEGVTSRQDLPLSYLPLPVCRAARLTMANAVLRRSGNVAVESAVLVLAADSGGDTVARETSPGDNGRRRECTADSIRGGGQPSGDRNPGSPTCDRADTVADEPIRVEVFSFACGRQSRPSRPKGSRRRAPAARAP
jgi:hypothetical protein